MMDQNNIVKSSFSNIVSSNCGGVISNSVSCSLCIFFCSFSEIESSDVGGAIYKTLGDLKCEKCAFLKCRTTLETSNLGGNAIKAVNVVMNNILCCASLCWINNECGDSTFHEDQSDVTFRDTNASYCSQNANVLASHFSESLKSTKESVKYCTTYGGSGHRAFIFSTPSEISYINVVYIIGSFLVSCSSKWAVVSNSFFYNNNVQSCFENVNAKDCFGDIACDGIVSDAFQTIRIESFTFENSKIYTKLFTNFNRNIIPLTLINLLVKH